MIKKTINSVLSQDFRNFEIVIVDDGSTDNSVEIIKNSFNDERVKVFSQINKGASAARNKGVEVSSFNYLAFIDADDEWEPDYLTKIKESIALFPNAEMFCTAGILKQETGEVTYRASKKLFNTIKQIDFFKNPYFYTNTSSVVVTKNIFIAAGKFPESLKSNEDIACLHKLSMLTKVVYCGKPLSIYNRGIEGHLSSVKHFAVPANLVNRINYVHDAWLQSGMHDSWYLIFYKNEIRAELLRFLKSGNLVSANYILENIAPDLKRRFNKVEMSIYSSKQLKYLTYGIIYFKKVVFKIRTYGV